MNKVAPCSGFFFRSQLLLSESEEFRAHNVGIYCIKYTESKSVDLIQRNKDNAPMRYLVKTLTNIWVTKKGVQGGARNVIPVIVHITHFYYYKNI